MNSTEPLTWVACDFSGQWFVGARGDTATRDPRQARKWPTFGELVAWFAVQPIADWPVGDEPLAVEITSGRSRPVGPALGPDGTYRGRAPGPVIRAPERAWGTEWPPGGWITEAEAARRNAEAKTRR